MQCNVMVDIVTLGQTRITKIQLCIMDGVAALK